MLNIKPPPPGRAIESAYRRDDGHGDRQRCNPELRRKLGWGGADDSLAGQSIDPELAEPSLDWGATTAEGGGVAEGYLALTSPVLQG